MKPVVTPPHEEAIRVGKKRPVKSVSHGNQRVMKYGEVTVWLQ